MSTIVYVYMQGPNGGSWSRYFFPYDITEFAQLNNRLYVRHTIDGVDSVSVVTEGVQADEYTDGDGAQTTYFNGMVQWPWLDFGNPGVTKMVEGFDVIATQDAQISFFYDERQPAIETPPYQLDVDDTIPGMMVPMPFSAPSISPCIRFLPDEDSQAWELLSVNVTLHDFSVGR
jgi:hypothetical protein